MDVQSVLIPKSKYTLSEANKWINKNNLKKTFYGKPVDITNNFYRFRQKKPNRNMSYVSKRIKNGIILILYHP